MSAPENTKGWLSEARSQRKFWRTLLGVLVVQAAALGLLWILQTIYGL